MDDGTELRYDLVVVGAGPAGISIVERLAGSGMSIGLIESGGFHPELRTQRLYRGEVAGDPYFGLDTCRYRMFGGTSNRWGGWCRPMDPIDFERRDWIGESGWPIRSADLEPFYPDAARMLELSSPDFSLSGWSNRLPEPLPLGGEEFDHTVFQYSPPTNFAERYGPGIFVAPSVTTLTHANVTELLLEDARVVGLRVSTLTGRSFMVRPKMVVLATGGIENARLLLASRNQRPLGIGNENGLVGRYFMEHLHVATGHIVATDAPIARDFYRKAVYGDAIVRGVVTPRAQALARRQLPSCSIALEKWAYSFHGTPFLGWPSILTTTPATAYRRLHQTHALTAERLKGWSEVAWKVARIARHARSDLDARGRSMWRPAREGYVAALYFRTEQAPDASNRVSLSERRDELGVPLSRLEWRVRDNDRSAITSWLAALDDSVRAAGIGHVMMPIEGWESGITGGPHHMGTTRMSADPRHGVVDGDCRLHSVDNLSIAGSSVFTTSGYVNPTFTIVALALRLADRIQHVLAA